MPNYQQGKIYCIRSHKTDDIYIGSTTKQYLSQRLGQHKTDYRIYLKTNKNYVSSYKILKYDDAYIELITTYSCSSKEELNREEGKYQRQMDCINKNIAGRTSKQYKEDNKELIKEVNKTYCKNNKEHIATQKKDYYNKNKESILNQKKEYRKQNQDKLKEKFNCDCGGKYTLEHKQHHNKTKKHKTHILNKV